MATPGRVGDLVREFRSRSGLTQRSLADLAGLSVAALRDLEQGRVVAPRVGTLRRLADALALSRVESSELMRVASHTAGARRGVRVNVLGPLTVLVDGEPADLGSETQQLIVGMLALGANVPVSRDALIERAWGPMAPAAAVDSLQSRISRIRRRLQSTEKPGRDDIALVTAAHGGYQLNLTAEQLDILEFRRLVDQARRARQAGELSTACELYGEAMRLWRGDPLQGLTAMAEEPAVVALARERQTVVIEYAGAASDLGRHEQVVPLLEAMVSRDPLDEMAHARLMIALTGSGRQGRALELYEAIRTRLVDELGADPGPSLREAHRRVLQHDVVGADSAPVSAHRQLPPDIAEFSGRVAALATLREMLPPAADAGTAMPILTIEGMGGVGKTRLAVHLAHQLLAEGRYGDEQLYVDLRGHADQPPADASAVLASFLHLLGVAGEQIPRDLAGRSALYRDRLYGKNALIVLDDPVSEDQVLPLLPGSPRNLVLITTRTSLALDGSAALVLDAFTQQEAERFFADVLGSRRVAADPSAVGRVVRLCGRLPLALALAARRLQARPGWGFADLARRLEDSRDKLTELASGSEQLRAVFDLSYQALDTDERRVFRLLGLHPGEDFTATSVAALAGISHGRAQRLLDRLVDEHLLGIGSGSRYRMHDLLREYASQLAQSAQTPQEIRRALTRLLDLYLGVTLQAYQLLHPRAWTPHPGSPPAVSVPKLTSRQDASRWWDTERACLLSVVTLAVDGRWTTHAWQLACLLRHLHLEGYDADLERVQTAALRAAVAGGDEVGAAVMRTYLSPVSVRQGRAGEALDHLERAVPTHRRAGDLALEKTSVSWLGAACYRLGRLPDALGYIEQAIALCAGRDLYREAHLQVNRGWLLLLLGRTEESLTSCDNGLALARSVGSRASESLALANIADITRLTGDPQDAVAALRTALSVATAVGISPNEAYVRRRLGLACRDTGSHEESLACLTETLRLVRAVRGPVSESEVLIDLAVTHQCIGNWDTAYALCTEAKSLAIETRERYQHARALEGIAACHQNGGRTRIAREYGARARELFIQCGVPRSMLANDDARDGQQSSNGWCPGPRQPSRMAGQSSV